MSELDELDREEFYRLKKVQGKKQRDEQEIEGQRQESNATMITRETLEDAPEERPDILADNEDEDVIF